MKNACPVCSQPEPFSLFEKTYAPILMHKLYATPEAAKAAKLGLLEMVGCKRCGFVWNRSFDPSLIEYSEDYENNQTHSAAFSKHLDLRIVSVLSSLPATTMIDYLEIGCGQGDFMERVLRAAPGRFESAEGFDTVWRGSSDRLPSSARIHKSYFDEVTARQLKRSPNIVVSRHTIEHVPDPISFLSSIRNALGANSRAKIFIETPCARWIVENAAVQDFFYEHCSIFTAESLALALEKSGFEHPAVERVFGDQYLWATATAGERNEDAAIEIGKGAPLMDDVRSSFLSKWSKEVASQAQRGPVAIWGAGAKGITFALLLGQSFDHVIDINPGKQRHFMPGSGIPIVTPAQSAARNPRAIFVMNPNYMNEISAMARAVGIAAELIAIS
jgi:2-polyprenyl-3-methyl-5-hydroxy-6-metoxy-1,4-benzoquinol methylase